MLSEAWVSLGAHKLRTALMTLGVLVGVASLTSVVCVGQGTRDRIQALVAKHGLDMLMVRPGNPSIKAHVNAQAGVTTDAGRPPSSLVEEDAYAIEASVPNVRHVAVVQNQRGLDLRYGETSIKTRVFGVSPAWELIRRREVLLGEGVTDEDMAHAAKVTVLGYNTWHELFGDADPVGKTVYVNGDAYKVKGVYVEMGVSAGGDQWDDRIVVPFTTSKKKLFGRAWLEQIVMQVKDVTRIHQTKDEVLALLRERHRVPAGQEADFFVRDPEDLKEVAAGASNTLTRLLLVTSGIALLVGGAVIMNIMLISVSERAREIGLRRALGARRGDVTAQFLLESVLVAAAGGALGVLAGAALSPAVAAFGEKMVSKVTWLPFAVSALACGAVAVLFGLYPARKAARVDPVEALRSAKL
jgi:putative ABC transport system permease protein